MVKVITKEEGFSLNDIRLLFDETFNDHILLSSCFTDEYTKTLLETNKEDQLEFVTGVYDDSGTIFHNEMKRKVEDHQKLTVKYLKDFETNSPDTKIERDIEDGFVYDYYRTITYNNKFIVFSN